MKTVVTFIICLFAALTIQAQGIQFKNEDFETVLAKAAQQNKLLFVDFYTQWCGPCKSMSANTFTKEEVGVYFNENFLNLKLDAEAEGKEQARKYGVQAYPCLVFINGKGEAVHQLVGACDAETLIKEAQRAMSLAKDPENLSTMRAQYQSRRQDERFLKKFVEKMVEIKSSPINAINDYLKIQTEMKPDQFEMMEFLIKNSKYLLCGGEGERIFNENIRSYMEIATKGEENKLKQIPLAMLMQTRQVALSDGDPLLYGIFMDKWRKSPDKSPFHDYNSFRLEMLQLQKDTKGYHTLAAHYLDSLCKVKTIEQIRKDDRDYYAATCKRLEGYGGLFVVGMKEDAKNVWAKNRVSIIDYVGRKYLRESSKKNEYKQLMVWAEYAQPFLPEDFRMTNFIADIHKQQGNKKEALVMKQKALEMLPTTDKNNRQRIQSQIDQMNNK